MLTILERLAPKRAEKLQTIAATRAQLVVDVVDERITDADEIISALDRLGMTAEELATCCDLLKSRRAWAADMTAGKKAEAVYEKLLSQAAAAEKELEGMIEAHHEKMKPLENKLDAARDAISKAHDARRRLHETASTQARRAAFSELDTQLRDAEAEVARTSKPVEDRKHWIVRVKGMGENAATADVERLPEAEAGLKQLQAEAAAAQSRCNELQEKRNAAFEMLLNPEAI